MTITRRWTSGAENIDIEFNSYDGGFQVHSTKVNTGNYAFKSINASASAGKNIVATNQARTGFYWLGTRPLDINQNPGPVQWHTSTGSVLGKLYTNFDGGMLLDINGSSKGYALSSYDAGKFVHIGVDINTDSA